jgi:methionine-R-sulfoxide reductase
MTDLETFEQHRPALIFAAPATAARNRSSPADVSSIVQPKRPPMRFVPLVSSLILTLLIIAVSAVAQTPPAPTPPPTTPPPASADGAFARRLSDAQLEARKKQLPPDVFNVTQKEGTEPAFNNAYWNNHAPGIYVDVVSGEPLFSSLQKFESGTGWPSFFAPLEKSNVVTRNDPSLGVDRTEVRSRIGKSHLGHVFPDGPAPTHLRYCMDSASLRFIPAEQLTAQGYADYVKLFPGVKQQPR